MTTPTVDFADFISNETIAGRSADWEREEGGGHRRSAHLPLVGGPETRDHLGARLWPTLLTNLDPLLPWGQLPQAGFILRLADLQSFLEEAALSVSSCGLGPFSGPKFRGWDMGKTTLSATAKLFLSSPLKD